MRFVATAFVRAAELLIVLRKKSLSRRLSETLLPLSCLG